MQCSGSLASLIRAARPANASKQVLLLVYMIIKKILILITLAFLMQQCSTVSSLKHWSKRNKPVVYSGVRSCWSSIPGGQGPVAGPAALFTAMYCLLDTPFSFLLDTVLLPAALPFSAGKYLFYKDSIYIAVREQNTERIQYYIGQGADLNSEDSSGRTVLDYAFAKCILHKQGSPEERKYFFNLNRRTADLLFARGARKTSFKAGSTILHYAAYCGYKDMAEVLLKEGFDPARRNSEGISSAQIAEEENQEEILVLFRKAVRK